MNDLDHIISMRFTRWMLGVQYLFEGAEILKETKQYAVRIEDLGWNLDVMCSEPVQETRTKSAEYQALLLVASSGFTKMPS